MIISANLSDYMSYMHVGVRRARIGKGSATCACV